MRKLKKKLEAYLQYIKTELIMHGYLDGWTIIHWKKKKKEVEEHLKRLKELEN
jgi:hypothetical protein